MGPIVLNLLEAVGDARDANSAAMMRYPLALPAITTDLQQAASRFVADVIEERTGHRPSTQGIQPEVKLDGFDVDLTLNGVPADKLKGMSMGDLVAEVTTRTTEYAGVALTLLGTTSENEDRLSFQADLLETWRDAMSAKLEGTEGAVDISDIEVTSKPAPASGADTKAKSERRSFGGLSIVACSGPSKNQQRVAKKTGKRSAKSGAKPGAKTRPAGKRASGAKGGAAEHTLDRQDAHEGPGQYVPNKGGKKAAPAKKDDQEWIDLPGDSGPVGQE